MPNQGQASQYNVTPTFKPLRIALVGYRSAPHVGGQGIYIRHLATALKALGHHVSVISGPPYPALPSHIPLIALPSLNLYEHHNPLIALRPKHFKHLSDLYEWWGKMTGHFAEPYSFGRRLAQYLKVHRQDYDIIHDNQTLCYSLLKLPLPVVATVHHPITRDRDHAIETAKNRWHRWGTRRWYSFLKMQQKVTKQLPSVVTVSSSSQQDIEACFGRPSQQTQVIFNGIDTAFFSPQQYRVKREQELLATCSSDQPVKGFSVLLDAYAQLLKSKPTLLLKVIGKLNPKGANAQKLKALGLENKVQFVSGLSDKDMVIAYNKATVFVCPSLYEGFGLPIAEAMSCATAVVTSDGGALAEVAGDAALVVPAGNPKALALAIAQALDDETLRHTLEQKGRARAVEMFCWHSVAKQYAALYHQTIAAQTAASTQSSTPPTHTEQH
ncbi:glycosyltransferase family 4 protein [Marinagarivorans algicola]|uniref:glycosyltransferase family 4 protein n=1 Tax=Marinagarivorans algicola TaxID=1513270 RepID=UPI0037361E08